ncbi:hypothetical protein D3C81_1337170 [compost metagenome]
MQVETPNSPATPDSPLSLWERAGGEGATSSSDFLPFANLRAVPISTASKRTLSPALSCPSCHRSASITVTGQTKPPRLGPSGPRITGMSPVKSTAPMA